jgi:spore coat protein CotH
MRSAVSKLFASVFVLLIGSIVCCAETEPANGATAASMPAASNLPILFLDAKEPIVSERKVPCAVRMILPPGIAGDPVAVSGSVRIHGATSQGYPKKSYAVTLETPVPWLGMRTSTQWVLNAAFVDRSLMRHKLSYDLFRSLSAAGVKRYAVESRFVEVYFNGEYNGAYLLMERVDRALLELRSFDNNTANPACIYKAEDHSANFSQPGHAGYSQREPDPMVKQYWEPLDELNQFVSRASDAEFKDAQRGIATRLDLDNAVDFQLLVLLTSNLDGITKNFVLARDAVMPNAPGPRFFFAPWDYDATFGRNWDATRVTPTAWLSNHLFDRLHADAAFREKFGARWRQLRESEFAVATIHGLIDDNARTLGEAAQRNADRWRTLEGPYPDRLTFAEDLAQMKGWIVARVKWLDAEIARRSR